MGRWVVMLLDIGGWVGLCLRTSIGCCICISLDGMDRGGCKRLSRWVLFTYVSGYR